MSLSLAALTVYGLLLFIGAYFGWKAGSRISLISGTTSGVITLLGVYLAQSEPTRGYAILTLVSGILSITFLMRWVKTRKMMPSGMLLLMSLAAVAISIKNFLHP